MTRFSRLVILAKCPTPRPIFISWKRNVGLRNKIGSGRGMPGRIFRPRRCGQTSRISTRFLIIQEKHSGFLAQIPAHIGDLQYRGTQKNRDERFIHYKHVSLARARSVARVLNGCSSLLAPDLPDGGCIWFSAEL